MSEAGVKRMFSKESMTMKKMEEVCEAIGTRLLDVAALAQRQTSELQSELNTMQEEELALDSGLLKVFYLVLNGWKIDQLATLKGMGINRATRFLKQLDDLELIEWHPHGHIRLLTQSSIRWNPDGPINKKYDRLAMSEFLFERFRGDQARFHFLMYQFSPASVRYLKSKIDRLNADIISLSETDAEVPIDQKTNFGILAAMRPWTFSALK